MFHRGLKGIGATELGIDDNEPDGPVDLIVLHERGIECLCDEVEHTVRVRATSSMMPMVKPACRNAYGCPCCYASV